MTLTSKGEFSNYWGTQAEDVIFGATSTNLDNVMPPNDSNIYGSHFAFDQILVTKQWRVTLLPKAGRC